MSDYEGLEYLKPGFDPSTMTVPRLRSVLVSHDVSYPSAAKKGQLIQIFNEDLLPQSRRIVSVRARARRTSMGITDADSQETTVSEETDEQEEEEEAPLPRPRTSRRQPSARLQSEDNAHELRVTRSRSPTKRTPRPSTKHARTSDNENSTDAELPRTVRKSRRSATPNAATAAPPTRKIKPEDVEDEIGGSRRRESAFTYDNPFQSGSSPPSDSKSSGDRRRRTVGISSTSRKSTSANRRRTDGPPKIDDGIYPPKAAVFKAPISDYDQGLIDVDDNGVEASEEFTPEEQLDMEQEQAAKGVDALGPRRPRRQQGGFNITGPIWLVLITLLGGYAMWYRQEKVAVGYCGVGRDALQRFPDGVEVPDWLQVLVEPECEPCPQHAYCSGNLQTDCEADFVLKSHPLSLGGIVPLPPTCEPDGEKVRRVKAVADRAVEELRERKAKFECGDLTNEAGLPEPTLEIDAEELKKEVSKKRRKGMGEAEFEELWAGAIGEIEGRDEVVSVSDG